ncbi:prepilin-type N-terminal cleavage/methylation domain-containing protein [Castellaniella sp. GW247-6E4]|uniref:prepilin-type N-terminal cleavage/methylation domain-containing protein n=1 Tax=Castellaniella sp. GW247-6E4 TaxID=3140380 RepID=UPI003315DCA8
MKTFGVRARGFTLIEVLVALALLALLSLISWRGLDAAQQTGERLDERAEETLALVRVFSQLERDVLLHPAPGILPEPALAAPGKAAMPASMPPGMAWSPSAGLSLVRSAGAGRWQQVRWHLEDGALYRAAGPASPRLPLSAADSPVKVMSGLRAWSVRFWLPGQGWIDPARGSGRAAGPQAYAGLEISLRLAGSADGSPYRKVVVLQ